ncbi:MAG TPA: prepilin-type N-terminal cleavage/methylation domain-containing protein [Candidatus Didemnitutus sp.]|nr:prepilin-type N-terminal cleavage/methylation domain-containing protein [Candidatus Didemnitutus sp.]
MNQVSRLSSARRRARGFTLVEIMVVVVIIGLLAAIAIPAFQRVREKARLTRVANDLRVFAQAFDTYVMEQGSWPADVSPGVIPAELVGRLPITFTQPTPLGGQYEWDNEPGLKSITLYNLNASVAMVTKLDKMIDDGNPNTGNFQYNGSEWHYLLEQ